MVAITPGAIQLGAVGLLVFGVLALVRAQRSEFRSLPLAGLGSLLATLGAGTAWRALTARSSVGGPLWASIRDVYRSMFDSWLYVFVVGSSAALLWVVVAGLIFHKWSVRSTVATLIGSLVGSMSMGLLDSSI